MPDPGGDGLLRPGIFCDVLAVTCRVRSMRLGDRCRERWVESGWVMRICGKQTRQLSRSVSGETTQYGSDVLCWDKRHQPRGSGSSPGGDSFFGSGISIVGSSWLATRSRFGGEFSPSSFAQLVGRCSFSSMHVGRYKRGEGVTMTSGWPAFRRVPFSHSIHGFGRRAMDPKTFLPKRFVLQGRPTVSGAANPGVRHCRHRPNPRADEITHVQLTLRSERNGVGRCRC